MSLSGMKINDIWMENVLAVVTCSIDEINQFLKEVDFICLNCSNCNAVIEDAKINYA